MKAQKLLLFGGTFDPPHNGHMHSLRAALAAVQPDRAVVMPAGTPPHKQASATPAHLRLAMCACFLQVDPRVTVSDWEIRRGGQSYTVDTLRMLAAACPQAQLYLYVGGDMLATFTQWHCWQSILAMATLVAQSRTPDGDGALQAAAAALQAQGGRVLLTREPALPCASTQIRARLRAGQSAAEFLPPAVHRLIGQHGLYGPAQRGETVHEQ